MFQKVKFNQTAFLLLFSIISIANLFSADPKSSSNLRFKKEQKIYEELEKTELFPSAISNIISGYTAPKSILLNFLIPNFKGNVKVEYMSNIKDDKTIDRLLKQYPDIKSEAKHISDFVYEYNTTEDPSFGKILISTRKNYPITPYPKIRFPLNLRKDNILLKFSQLIFHLDLKDKEYRFALDSFSRDFSKIFSFTNKQNIEVDVKLIEDINECKDNNEIVLKSYKKSILESMKALKEKDELFICLTTK